jgi:hypothetical protein
MNKAENIKTSEDSRTATSGNPGSGTPSRAGTPAPQQAPTNIRPVSDPIKPGTTGNR